MSNRRRPGNIHGKPVSSHDKPNFNPRLITPKPGPLKAVVLDPIDPLVEPPYCTHGKTTCYACGDWVWLGCESYEMVSAGEAAGLCLPCATKYVPAGTEPIGHVTDELHHDG